MPRLTPRLLVPGHGVEVVHTADLSAPMLDSLRELMEASFDDPYLLFVSLTAFAGGILNTWGRFAVPAFTPVLLNLTLIGFAVWLAPLLDEPGMALAYAVFVAGVIQLAFQLPFLARLRMLSWPRWRPVPTSSTTSATWSTPPCRRSSSRSSSTA